MRKILEFWLELEINGPFICFKDASEQNDEPPKIKYPKVTKGNQSLTEEPILNKQILQALISHAEHIAKLTLQSKDSGKDLVKDIKV